MLGDTLFKIVALFVDFWAIYLHIIFVADHEGIGSVL